MAEIGLALALGLVAILIIYRLFAPLAGPSGDAPVLAAAGSAPTATTDIANPFRQAETAMPLAIQEDTGPDLAETSLNLKLHGTLTADDGGTAIILLPDGSQKRFEVGETVWQGVTLSAVYRDQVVLSSSGVRESLRLINRESRTVAAAPRMPTAPVQSGPSTPESAAAARPASIGNLVRFSPEPGPGGIRIRLTPGPDGTAFATAGLKAGDYLVAVDNKRLTTDFASEAKRLNSLSGRDRVSITIERDGVMIPIELKLANSGVGGNRN